MAASVSRRQVVGVMALSALAGQRVEAQQPHMQAAKDKLQEALKHLEQASGDKGGHRVAAIKAAKDALDHVEKGIRDRKSVV